MLLWVFILSVFGRAWSPYSVPNLPARLKANVLAVQSSIAGCVPSIHSDHVEIRSCAFPRRRSRVAILNPILQDPGLAIHPPLLYVGYVGLFDLVFPSPLPRSLMGASMPPWARWVRPWTLLAWIFLTLGIAMGLLLGLLPRSGWGGWWFWDPVENASLVPWLAATALLHSALVMEKNAMHSRYGPSCLHYWPSHSR